MINKRAFTLAETLITLMVIGIVSALTIPALMQMWKDRQYESAYKKMHSTMMNGFNQMIAEETLAGNESTEELVERMQNAFKISKTCNKDDLAGCFASTISTDDEAIELSKIKTAKNLGKEWTSDTNVNGVVLADGTSLLVAYNKECPTGGKDREKDIIQNCVAIVYDLDSSGKSNKMGKDIRTYNASIETGMNCGNIKLISSSTQWYGINELYEYENAALNQECMANNVIPSGYSSLLEFCTEKIASKCAEANASEYLSGGFYGVEYDEGHIMCSCVIP